MRASAVPGTTPAAALGEVYLQARAYIVSRRNADGTFGENYDQERVRVAKENPVYDVDVGGTLHTTYVCLWALTQPVFEGDMPSAR